MKSMHCGGEDNDIEIPNKSKEFQQNANEKEFSITEDDNNNKSSSMINH